jgi:ribosomal protein L29
MYEKEIRKMTVVKLKEKLKDMGAETTGLKQVLVSRLLKEIEK